MDQQFSVGREPIRQIEAKALRKRSIRAGRGRCGRSWIDISNQGVILLHKRLAQLSGIATVFLMFGALVLAQPWLARLSSSNQLLAAIPSLLASAGLYSLLYRLLFWLFGKNLLLRRLVLGRSFLEGTWIGHYVTECKHRFTIEFISQHTGTTVIVGREFESDGTERAAWTSDAVSIDEMKSRLTYTYGCDLYHKKHGQQGLGVFTIKREKSTWPDKLTGYAVDLIDGERDSNTEVKISHREIADVEALAKAREHFCA